MGTGAQMQKQAGVREQVIFDHAQRRTTVVDVINAARKRLRMAVFRCDDFKVLDALDDAVRRGVRVEALLTPRAKGWEQKLSDLEDFLEAMGATVHRFRDPVVKYHAKYIVADDGPALVCSLNFIRKCFEETCDFILVSHEREIVQGLQRLFDTDSEAPESTLPEGLTERLIVSPECARAQFTELIGNAQKSVRIIDRRLDDPAMLALLKKVKARGVSVEVLGGEVLGTLRSHGRLLLVDGKMAVFGSISLEAVALDFRREVGVVMKDPALVSQLDAVFTRVAAMKAPRVAAARPRTTAATAKPRRAKTPTRSR